MLQVMCSWSPMFTHPVLQFLFISFCAIQCTAHVCCTGSMIYAWCIVYKAKFFLWRPTSAQPHWQAGTVHALHLFPFFASLTQHPPTDPPTHLTSPTLMMQPSVNSTKVSTCSPMAMKEWAILISWLECPMWPPLHWLEQNIIYSSWNQI